MNSFLAALKASSRVLLCRPQINQKQWRRSSWNVSFVCPLRVAPGLWAILGRKRKTNKLKWVKNRLALASPEPHQRSELLVPGGSGVAAWSLSFGVAPHPCGRVSWGDDPAAPPHTLLLPSSPNPLQEREMRRIPPGPGPCQDSGPPSRADPRDCLGNILSPRDEWWWRPRRAGGYSVCLLLQTTMVWTETLSNRNNTE